MPRAVGTSEEKSIRKIPAGKPGELEEPRRIREEELEPVTGVGIGVGETAEEKLRKRRLKSTVFKPESPFLMEGKDEFLSPESDIPDGKTKILKQVAYNVRSTAVGKYLSRMKPGVVNLWHLNVMNHTFYPRSERTSVLFQIMPDGSLGNVMLNKHQGPQNEILYSINAVEHAQPFEPLNEEILEHIKDEGLWLEFEFIYR